VRVVSCSVCRRQRHVNGFGRCTVCSTVIAEQQLEGKLGLYVVWGLKRLAPLALLAVLTYFAADAAWWNGRHSTLFKAFPGTTTTLLLAGSLLVAAPFLIASGRQ